MLSNNDIQKLLTVLASKEDLKKLATKEELSEVKEDLKNLATKEELKSLATKEDLKSLATKKDLNRVEEELKNLNEKVDTIVEFTHAIDEDTNKRLKRVEKHLNLPLLQT